MSTQPTTAATEPETVRVVSAMAADVLARIRQHAAARGHTTDAGALRFVALVGLATLDAEARGLDPQA